MVFLKFGRTVHQFSVCVVYEYAFGLDHGDPSFCLEYFGKQYLCMTFFDETTLNLYVSNLQNDVCTLNMPEYIHQDLQCPKWLNI